jgi:hypothetical protein
MKALTLNAETKEIQEKEIELQANTIYSFFNSILIDELTTLQNHVVYTDANAISEKKEAYFIGEQLLVGDALILGRNGLEEIDVTIPKEELSSLIRAEVNEFYKRVLEILADTDINLYRTFELKKQDETMTLNTEWVLYTFNIADTRTQEYFIDELKKSLEKGESCELYMQKMAGLAINSVS